MQSELAMNLSLNFANLWHRESIWDYAKSTLGFPERETVVLERFPVYHRLLKEMTGESDHSLVINAPSYWGYRAESGKRASFRVDASYTPATFLPFGGTKDLGSPEPMDDRESSRILRSIYGRITMKWIESWEWIMIAEHSPLFAKEHPMDSPQDVFEIQIDVMQRLFNRVPFALGYKFCEILSLPSVQAVLDGRIDQRCPKTTMVGKFLERAVTFGQWDGGFANTREVLTVLTEFLNPVKTLKLGEVLYAYCLGEKYGVESLSSLVEEQLLHADVRSIKALLSYRNHQKVAKNFYAYPYPKEHAFTQMMEPLLEKLRKRLDELEGRKEEAKDKRKSITPKMSPERERATPSSRIEMTDGWLL